MWQRFPRTRQQSPEAPLSPRRPRTPLKISTDLAAILAAQELKPYQRADPAPGKTGKSDGQRGVSPDVQRNRSPNAHQAYLPDGRRANSADTHRNVLQSGGHAAAAGKVMLPSHLGERKNPTSEPPVGALKASQIIEPAMKSVDLAVVDADDHSSEAKGTSKLFPCRRLANLACRPSLLHNSGSGARPSNTHHIENRTRAREPGETQRLSGDLKLLERAAALSPPTPSAPSQPRGPRNTFEAVMMEAGNSNRRGSHNNHQHFHGKRKSSEYERPWRTGPATPRRSRNSNIGPDNRRPSSRSSVRKTLLATSGAPARASIINPADLAPQHKADPFLSGIAGASQVKSKSDDSGAARNMWKVSADYKIPVDMVKAAWEIFRPRARLRLSGAIPSHGATLNTDDLILTKDGFGEVFAEMMGGDVQDADSVEIQFHSMPRGAGGALHFGPFALWYSEHGFDEEVLLTKEERDLRDLSRKLNLPEGIEIERMRGIFNQFDIDGNGTIDYKEFEKLLHSMLKVPAHLDLPEARVKQFWRESDIDNSGEICFEEFLRFYLKVFNSSETDAAGSIHQLSPLEAFYRGMRPNAMRGSYAAPGADSRPVNLSPRQSVGPAGGGGPRVSVNAPSPHRLPLGDHSARLSLKPGANPRGSLHQPTFFQS